MKSAPIECCKTLYFRCIWILRFFTLKIHCILIWRLFRCWYSMQIK